MHRLERQHFNFLIKRKVLKEITGFELALLSITDETTTRWDTNKMVLGAGIGGLYNATT
jgi:hypothetical protein